MLQAPCPDWADDDAEHASQKHKIQGQQARDAALSLVRQAYPDVAALQRWHKIMFDGIAPGPYAGRIRQDDYAEPCLRKDVTVGPHPGSPFAAVPGDLTDCVATLAGHMQIVELRWEQMTAETRIKAVASIVGRAVGRFVQIHPFLNGNGRTSRLLWEALLFRLGLPAQNSIVRRPAAPYGELMRQAMLGNFVPTIEAVFLAICKGPFPPGHLPT